MRILMSQRDLRIPPNNFLFDCLERSWYNLLHKHQLLPVANIGVIDETVEFDCLILTGGPDSLARHTTENLLFLHALKLNKPIVGVCHGAFAVNDLTGGINGIVPGHENTSHTISMEGGIYNVNSFHGQNIAKLGNQMIPVATDMDGNIEAFQHESKPIYGVVWHPERMKYPILPKAVVELLDIDPE
jgi:putative glutamine amidotransferase